MEWAPIDKAPYDCDLEICVIEGREVHALVFPCRLTAKGWRNALTGDLIRVRPTHCRRWAARYPGGKH